MSLLKLFKKEKTSKKEKDSLVSKSTSDKVVVDKKTAVSKPASRQGKKENILFSGKRYIKKPWVSEKTTGLVSINQYVFLVDKSANKPLIREEVERHYGVQVESVNMILKRGKIKRLGRSISRRPSFKKAVVTLKAGQKLDIYPQ